MKSTYMKTICMPASFLDDVARPVLCAISHWQNELFRRDVVVGLQIHASDQCSVAHPDLHIFLMVGSGSKNDK